MIYTSTSNEKIKNIKKLQNKKYRDQENLFIVEGEHLVKEAFSLSRLELLIVEENYDIDIDIPKMIVSGRVMKYLSELETPTHYLGVVKKNNNNFIGKRIIALDGVQDPGNLGTIIRSSVAFNFDTILLSKDCVDTYNSKVLRATQGMILKVNIIRCDLCEVLSKLDNYKIYGTSVVNGKNIKDVKEKNNIVVVMGNEGTGVTNEVQELCNDFIYIPMNKNCESLNVAVASSIIMHELN
ncbi:MAG: RNA methyltransferase [Tenericutes bacterium]|nr:RNA methyltransferase [Mycoplasmatota bacterium]MDY3800460.1 RNA methyltransferase [Bacilli bacterium]